MTSPEMTATTIGDLINRAEREGVAVSGSLQEAKAWERWLVYFDVDWDTPVYYLANEDKADAEAEGMGYA